MKSRCRFCCSTDLIRIIPVFLFLSMFVINIQSDNQLSDLLYTSDNQLIKCSVSYIQRSSCAHLCSIKHRSRHYLLLLWYSPKAPVTIHNRPRMREGNVFILSVRLSICLSVQAITFECFDIETWFLVWWYIFI